MNLTNVVDWGAAILVKRFLLELKKCNEKFTDLKNYLWLLFFNQNISVAKVASFNLLRFAFGVNRPSKSEELKALSFS